MHDTFISGIKFHLDHFNRHQNTYFLAGWVHSTAKKIEVLRIEALGKLHHEVTEFEVRHDVNAFHSLPQETCTGFKCILQTTEEFAELIVSVRLENDQHFRVIKGVDNPHLTVNSPTTTTAGMPTVGIRDTFPGMVVIESFYDNPEQVRAYALQQEFKKHSAHHKGERTETKTIFPGTKECFERILQKKITNWESHIYNGVFQYCIAEDPIVYHTDNQSYAAVVYLTPNAPAECGTSFYRSRFNGLMREPETADCERLNKSHKTLVEEMFAGNYYDKSRWETVDVIGNVFNRMVLWDAKKVHAASQYFGDSAQNGRLFHMFFFDAE